MTAYRVAVRWAVVRPGAPARKTAGDVRAQEPATATRCADVRQPEFAKPKLLDLFCGAGGAAMGYHRAGFEVVGVDIKPQRRYPFRFVLGDALSLPMNLQAFDAIHASPPCQAFSVATGPKFRPRHPDLLTPTRDMLTASGIPFVIENVPGAPLRDPAILCGAAFGLCAYDPHSGRKLHLKRHRLFESSVPLLAPSCFCRNLEIGGVYGGGSGDRSRARNVRRGGYTPRVAVQRALMGCEWMVEDELSQAIPPAYTEFIGRQLLACLGAS